MAERAEAPDAAAAAPPEAPPPAEAEPLQVAPLDEETPYPAETQAAIQKFFKQRAKKPASFTYTANGDLEIKQGEKGAGTINLMRFIPLKPEEREALEQMRLDAIAEVEVKLEEKIAELREAWEEYRTTGSMRHTMEVNRAITELEGRRATLRSAVRSVVSLDNPRTRDVLFDQTYEERKLFYPSPTASEKKDPYSSELYALIFRNFKMSRAFGKYVPDEDVPAPAAPEVPVPGESAARQRLKDGRMARIFFDVDAADQNAFLSPMWPVEFTMNETRYFTALQAYEAERARELKMDALRADLLKTRSARMIRTITKKVVDHPVNAKALWLNIYTAVFQQHPELQPKLLDTGSDALVFADVRAGPSGIGLSDKSSGALDPSQWKGENAVGLALETVRTKLREATLAEAPEGEVKEAVITEEQQEKARVGAIINARRANGGR